MGGRKGIAFPVLAGLAIVLIVTATVSIGYVTYSKKGSKSFQNIVQTSQSMIKESLENVTVTCEPWEQYSAGTCICNDKMCSEYCMQVYGTTGGCNLNKSGYIRVGGNCYCKERGYCEEGDIDCINGKICINNTWKDIHQLNKNYRIFFCDQCLAGIIAGNSTICSSFYRYCSTLDKEYNPNWNEELCIACGGEYGSDKCCGDEEGEDKPTQCSGNFDWSACNCIEYTYINFGDDCIFNANTNIYECQEIIEEANRIGYEKGCLITESNGNERILEVDSKINIQGIYYRCTCYENNKCQWIKTSEGENSGEDNNEESDEGGNTTCDPITGNCII